MNPTNSLSPKENERLEFAERFLVRRHAYLAAAVMRLGELHFSDSDRISTACIIANRDRVRLEFNREFFNKIAVCELAGVLAHEALHFCLRHQQRYQAIRQPRDRWLFTLACEAVINDLITDCVTGLGLPGNPITGQTLLGWNVSANSAEEVMTFLRELILDDPALEFRMQALEPSDDHEPWAKDGEETVEIVWSDETEALIKEVVNENRCRDAMWGHVALGARRSVSTEQRIRQELSRFLVETIRCQNRYDTDWTRPNRKLAAVYPRVILPNYRETSHHRVLIALDASGSISRPVLDVLLALARQPIANATVSICSFDTRAYPVDIESDFVRGGGGTSVQAVEAYISENLEAYPDTVICLTDGGFSRPNLRWPDRWVWLLTPGSSLVGIPAGGRIATLNLSN